MDLIVFGISLPLLGLLILSVINTQVNYGEACEKLGFEDYEYKSDFQTCEDNKGNLYFIKTECDMFLGIWSKSCEAKEISVGDVRVLI